MEDLTSISVTIGKDKKEFRDILEYSISGDVLSIADGFSLKVANPDGARFGEILVGDTCEVNATDPRVSGGARTRLLKGIITDITESSDAEGGNVWQISGYDLGWHLMNNCGPLFLTLNGLTFGKMIDRVVNAKWGFAGVTGSNKENRDFLKGKLNQSRAGIAAARTPVGTFIPPICFEAGDMIADKLITYARRDKRLVGVSVDGWIMLYRPDYTTESVGTLHYHGPREDTRKLNNVKRAIVTKGIDGLYTDITCVGTVVLPTVLPDKYNPHAGNFKGYYQDPDVLPFPRFLSFGDSDVGVNGPNLPQATARAEWKAKRGKFDAWSAEYTFRGHVLEGAFLAPDTMISIEDTLHRVKGMHYISARRFSRDKSAGTITQLTVRKKGLLAA